MANAYTNHSLAICFMGDYILYQPSPKQFEAVQYLLAYGVARHYVAPDYKLVAHNQVIGMTSISVLLLMNSSLFRRKQPEVLGAMFTKKFPNGRDGILAASDRIPSASQSSVLSIEAWMT